MSAVAKRVEAVPDPEAEDAVRDEAAVGADKKEVTEAKAPDAPEKGKPEAGPAPSAPEAAPAKPRRKTRSRILMLAVPLALVLGGGYVWLTGGRYVATDNAYIHQPMVQVSPDVAGRITKVNVAENQRVDAGTPLFELDPEPFRIAVDQAQAALGSARLSVEQLRAAYDTATAKLTAAQTIQDVRKREYDRQQSLSGRGVSSKASLDESEMALQAADNEVALAKQGVAAAAAALGGDPKIATDDVPAVRAAKAALAAAERNLSKAEVVAPVSGIVSQIDSLNPGQYVAPGSTVASIVATDDTWVEANFKETQLEGLTIGQPVDVEIDAYPDFPLHGTVESFSSATGSQFSLIPAQNATGNWVKVVQRVPVRIAITPEAAHPLRDGMSVAVSVDTGHSRADGMQIGGLNIGGVLSGTAAADARQ